MKKGFALPLLIAFVASIGILGFALYKYYQPYKPNPGKHSIITPSENKTDEKNPGTDLAIDEKAFVSLGRMVITYGDRWLETQSYPKEMDTNRTEDLIFIKCTDIFQEGTKPFMAYNHQTKEQFEIRDPKLQKLISELNIKNDPGLITTKYCLSDSSDFIFMAGWGEIYEKINIALINRDGSLKTKMEFNTNGAPYFGCSDPLQLTTKGVLWLSCGGGDGPMGKSSIYKIDLNTEKAIIVKTCTSTTEDFGDQLGETKVECS